MKSYLVVICLSVGTLSSAQSQYQPDYIVRLYNDTVRSSVNLLASQDNIVADARVSIEIDGKEQVFGPQYMQAIYYIGKHYEPVFYEGNWFFMKRELSGDVTVFCRTIPTIIEGYIKFRYYFRQRKQPRGEIKKLTVKELKKISTYYCQPVMDSLLSVKYYSEVFLPDLIKQYNDRCPSTE